MIGQADTSSRTSGRTRTFDGLVTFGGGDWWYHNHGHYDIQMLRQFRALTGLPALYVNSLGVRIPAPSEGKMFIARVRRKAQSWARGFRVIEPGLAVVSPVAVPGQIGMRISRLTANLQLRRAMARMNMRHPLAWVECPSSIELLEHLPHQGLVYQRTDRSEAFPGANVESVRRYHQRLCERADVVLYASHRLLDEERGAHANVRFLDHGVDFEAFERAGLRPESPASLAGIPGPRVGFIGGIDEHTFDPALFLEVAARLRHCAFVLVGSCSLPPGWCPLPNVHQLGRKPYEEVRHYMAACDVLIMPWCRNTWIEACNPVKLKEYLAVGRPVVTSDFPELRHYEGFVRIARSSDEFVRAIEAALREPEQPERLRSRVRSATWLARGRELLGLLAEAGLRPGERVSDP